MATDTNLNQSGLTDDQIYQLLGITPPAAKPTPAPTRQLAPGIPAPIATKPVDVGPVALPVGAPEVPNQPAPAVAQAPNVFEQEANRAGRRLQELDTARRTPWGTDLGTAVPGKINPLTGEVNPPINPLKGPQEMGNHPGLLGKISHGLSVAGNIAGDILAPGTMSLIPGTQLNNQRETGLERAALEKAASGEEKSAAAKKDIAASKAPVQKFAFHYQDDKGDVFGVRPDGSVEKITDETGAKGKETNPDLKYVQNIQGPNGPQSGFVNAKDPYVTLDDIKSGGYPPEALGLMKFTGTVATMPKPAGKGTYKMVPDADGKNEQLQYFPPDDPTKGQPIGGKAPIGTNTPLLDPQGNIKGLFNNKTNAITPVAAAAGGETTVPEGATTSSGARLKNTEANQFNVQYENKMTDPQSGVETQYQKFQSAYNDRKKDPTGGTDMAALSAHIAATFGAVKGARVTGDMINKHLGARGWADNASVVLNQAIAGKALSENQWQTFSKLITATRQIGWKEVADAAKRAKLKPEDYLPKDLLKSEKQ